MAKLWTLIVSVLALFTALSAHADDAKAGWSGKGEVGYLMARGNSESDSANAKLDIAYMIKRWKHSFFLGGL